MRPLTGLHPLQWTTITGLQDLTVINRGSASSGGSCLGQGIWKPALQLATLLSIAALAACAAFGAGAAVSTHLHLHAMVLCPRRAGVAPCTVHSAAPCAPLSAGAQQLLNSSTLFTLLASTSTPGTLVQLRHMQRDLGPHRVFLMFDDTNERWTLTPAQRLTARRRPAVPQEALPLVLLFNRSEADAVAGRLAGKGGQNYYEAPAISLLYRYLEGQVTFDHVWRIEVGRRLWVGGWIEGRAGKKRYCAKAAWMAGACWALHSRCAQHSMAWH